MSSPLSPRTPEQRRWAADKIGDLANLAVAALIFGQVASGTFRLVAAALGLAMLLVAAFYGNRLLAEKDSHY